MEIEYASLTDRLKSMLIDNLLIVLVTFILSAIFDYLGDVPLWVRVSSFFIIWLIYEPVFTAYGCTLGKYVMRIRVRKATHPTQKIHIINSFIRYIIKMFMGWLSVLSIAFNPKRQAIHDLAIESIVVKV